MAANEMDHDSAPASATLNFEHSGPGQLLLQHRLSQLRANNSNNSNTNTTTSNARPIAPSSVPLKDIASALIQGLSGNAHSLHAPNPLQKYEHIHSTFRVLVSLP